MLRSSVRVVNESSTTSTRRRGASARTAWLTPVAPVLWIRAAVFSKSSGFKITTARQRPAQPLDHDLLLADQLVHQERGPPLALPEHAERSPVVHASPTPIG